MQIGKVDVELNRAYRMLSPRHIVLVTCADKNGKANIITLAWSMPASANPPKVLISLTKKRYSYDLIVESGEFVVNIPPFELVKETLRCGRISGRSVDKFKESDLTPLPAKMVKCPLIKECMGHLECKVDRELELGDHVLIIADVVAAHVNEGLFDGKWDAEKVRFPLHLGGDDFTASSKEKITPVL